MNQRIRQLAEQAVNSIPDQVDFDIPDVFKERFAALVAAAEREACAKVCEDLFDPRWRSEHNAASQCAEAIRARGKTE